MELVRVRVVQNDCGECLKALLAEARSLGGLPLGGEIVMVPDHWLKAECPHDSRGLKFQLVELDGGESLAADDEESEELLGAEGEESAERFDPKMDATKNIGYPVREHGPRLVRTRCTTTLMTNLAPMAPESIRE
jgi:hypothetical protein